MSLEQKQITSGLQQSLCLTGDGVKSQEQSSGFGVRDWLRVNIVLLMVEQIAFHPLQVLQS